MEKRESTLYTPLRWVLLGMLLLVGFLKPDSFAPTLGQPSQQASLPSLKWVYDFPRLEFAGVRFASGDPAVGLDGTVYVPRICLLALDPQGSLKWQTSRSDQSCLFDRTPVIDPQGDVYGLGYGIPLLALYSDGTVKWTQEVKVSGFLASSSLLAFDQDTIYAVLSVFGGQGGALVALDVQSGSLKWEPQILENYLEKLEASGVTRGFLGIAPPVILPEGSLLVTAVLGELQEESELKSFLLQYTFASDGSLERLVRTPLVRGESRLPLIQPILDPARILSPVLGADSTVYVTVVDRYLDRYARGEEPSSGTTLYAIDAEGNILWSWARLGESVITEPVLGADGIIYLGLSGQMHTLYALTPQGQLRWSFSLQDRNEIISGTPAIGADGVIYLPTAILVPPGLSPAESYGGKIYALSSEGQLLWTFETEGDIRSSPALAPDGTLYFTTVGPCQWSSGGGETNCEGRVYALQTGSPGLADSPWPMFRGDPQHSGRVHVPAQSR